MSLELREQIDDRIAAGDAAAALTGLRELWRTQPSSTIAGFVVPRYERLLADPGAPASLPSFLRHRVAILRSFTVEPLVPLLRAAAFAAGIHLDVRLGEFNAWAQELLHPDGPIEGFAADTVILAVQTRDAAPDLWTRSASLSAAEAESAAARVLETLEQAASSFRRRSTANLVIHSFELPAQPASGILDAQQADSQADCVRRMNQRLAAFARSQRGVYVLDYEALVARHGRSAWHDERKWLTVRLPVAASHLLTLVREWMRFLHPLTGKLAKVCVVDLDNTLWGGVIGEDGMTGIRLSEEYPGAAYQNLQRALLDLYERGILLAIASKNNPADALEAIERHPGMLLKKDHFAAMEIHWNPKAGSLRAIARDLNLGLDSLAFVDDNPVERQQVRDSLPEVMVVDLPDDPMRYAETVRDCPVFERLTLSAEDRQRGQMYAAERARQELQHSASSPEEFLQSLDQEAEIGPVTPMTLARVAQLTQKTNQFNLTTRRYSETQIEEMAARPGWCVYSLTVRDRYADNGLVGVAITAVEDGVCQIDTFLMSCRVISRGVETALLSHLAAEARRNGCRRLSGWFLPTKKNVPCRDFYEKHGFSCTESSEAGSQWQLDLETADVAPPGWIRVLTPAGVLA